MQSLPKSLFLFVFCVPLAIVLGVMLATPLDRTTLMIILATFLLLLSPILLVHHHAILIVSWNAYMNAFFLPGQPYIWMPMTLLSCFFATLTRTLNRGKLPFLNVPSVTWPLIILALVTYVTSTITGGIGAQVIGSDVYGGKRYLFLWGAIVGFFALSNIPIPENKRQLLAGLFFLSSVTAAVSNLAFMLGERFYFLFLLFPVEWAMTQAASEYSFGGFTRIGGLAPLSGALLSFLLLRYGIRGTLQLRHPIRIVLFVFAFSAALLSGFRATLLLVALLFCIQMLVEGLYKTKYMLAFGAALLIGVAILIPFANRLPISAQRCLTLLPLDLDQGAIDAARGSTEWRLEMWRAVIPDISKYLLMGKGFAIDPKDLYFAQQSISLRSYAPYEASLVAGDYHNGPLTVVIPFGIWGVLAMTWFFGASIRLLWRNYQYGEESIKNINTFLLTAFIAKLIFFLFIFGAFYLDLSFFTGIAALSVSLNRGMASP
ncbi:MAG TPA: O-antigen ligase family protein, partial [Verrucomicrobiae bacterium]|nr:O-antigen ligase family protein [Verrucomicrobiae bacterium]